VLEALKKGSSEFIKETGTQDCLEVAQKLTALKRKFQILKTDKNCDGDELIGQKKPCRVYRGQKFFIEFEERDGKNWVLVQKKDIPEDIDVVDGDCFANSAGLRSCEFFANPMDLDDPDSTVELFF